MLFIDRIVHVRSRIREVTPWRERWVQSLEKPRCPQDVLPPRVDAMPSARQSERNQQKHHRPVRRAGEQLEEELANLAARPHHTAETASAKKKEAHHELNAARMRLVDVVTELASCNVIKTRTRAMFSQGEPATQAKFRTRAVVLTGLCKLAYNDAYDTLCAACQLDWSEACSSSCPTT